MFGDERSRNVISGNKSSRVQKVRITKGPEYKMSSCKRPGRKGLDTKGSDSFLSISTESFYIFNGCFLRNKKSINYVASSQHYWFADFITHKIYEQLNFLYFGRFVSKSQPDVFHKPDFSSPDHSFPDFLRPDLLRSAILYGYPLLPSHVQTSTTQTTPTFSYNLSLISCGDTGFLKKFHGSSIGLDIRPQRCLYCLLVSPSLCKLFG
jgi:hypothetical protein